MTMIYVISVMSLKTLLSCCDVHDGCNCKDSGVCADRVVHDVCDVCNVLKNHDSSEVCLFRDVCKFVSKLL